MPFVDDTHLNILARKTDKRRTRTHIHTMHDLQVHHLHQIFHAGFLAFSSASLSASSFAFLLASRFLCASASFSIFFRSMISTALFIFAFSNLFFCKQNSYAPIPVKQKAPTAQLQAFGIGAVIQSISHPSSP